MTTCLDQALEMIDMGFSVIPVRPNDKRPIPGFSWRQYQERIATPEEVEAWFGKWPDANLALICGSISGVWALDADGPLGMAYIAEHCPRTSVYQLTPGGGVHAIYRLPRGKTVQTGARVQPELDIRGEGGYIVIAPSSIGGKAYQFRFLLDGWQDLAEWAYEPAKTGKGRPGTRIDLDLSRVKPLVDTEREVPQGQRNNELARVAGLYYAKGLGRDEVLALCEAWNRRCCRPPLGASELRATVASIGRRHAANHPEAEDQPDLKVVVPARELEALPREILYPGGLLEQVMEYIDASSAASFPLFNLAAAITLLGAVAGQRVMTETGLRTNFYCICLGYSGCGKDAPHSAINNLLSRSLAAGVIGPNSPTSAPAILHWMARADGAHGCCILLLDEIGLLLKGIKNPNSPAAQIPQALMELWSATDRPYTKIYAREKPIVLHWHHLGLYGTSTPGRFWEALTRSDITDGFLARLLVFESRHDAPMPKAVVSTEAPPTLVEALDGIWGIEVERTGGNLQMGGIPVPRMVPKTPGAAREFAGWAAEYHRLKNEFKEHEDGRSAIYGRAAEHAHKLALVHALSRCGARVVDQQVELEDVRWAMQVVDHLVPHLVQMVLEHVSDNEWERAKKKVLAFIRRTATESRPGATRRDILRNFSGLKRYFDDVVQTLLASGEIKEMDHKPKRGPKVKLLCLAQLEDNPSDPSQTRETRDNSRWDCHRGFLASQNKTIDQNLSVAVGCNRGGE